MMIAKLPKDIIFNILSKFPLKFLYSLRSVCKAWCKLIDDTELAIILLKVAQEEPMPLMLKHIPDDPCKLWFLHTIDDPTSLQIKIEKEKLVYKFDREISSRGYNLNLVVGSCNGLIYSFRNRDTFVVMDISRKRSYMLPPIEFQSRLMLSSGLGFDSRSGTFKMVCVFYNKPASSIINVINNIKNELITVVHVLGTDSWREISNITSYPIKGEGVYANGIIHWLFASFDLDEIFQGNDRRKLICFNVAREKFTLIDPPRETVAGERVDHLVDLQGEVGLVFNNVGGSMMEVWVLKDKEWVMHCRFRKRFPLGNGIITVLGYWNKDGDLLMTINRENEKRLFVYCLETGVSDEIRFHHCKYGRKTEIRMYRRSLFTIPPS